MQNCLFSLSFLLFLCQLASLVKTTAVEWIFSPSPYYELLLSTQSTTIQWISEAPLSGLIFVAAGNEGLIILDSQNHIVVGKITDIGTVLFISSSNDGKFIFFNYQGFISAFSVKNDAHGYSVNLIGQDRSNVGAQVNIIFIMNNEKWAAAIGDNMLVIYDITNEGAFKIIGQIFVGPLVFQIDQELDQYLFLAGEEMNIVRYTEEKGQVNLNIILTKSATFSFSNIVVTSNQKYIYVAEFWAGIQFGRLCDLSQIPDGTIKTDFQFEVQNWWISSQIPFVYSVKMTNDQKFIIIGVQQVGFYLFDISTPQTKSQLKLFQIVPSIGYILFSIISKDNKYIYYVNGNTFISYNKIQPNLNEEIPNIFNVIQANYTASENMFRWRCYITSNGQYFVGTYDKHGMFIYDLHNDPLTLQLKHMIVPQDMFVTDSVIIDEEKGYIISPGDYNKNLLFVYSISDIQTNPSMSPLFSLEYGNSFSIEGITYNHNKSLIGIAAQDHVILVDSSNGPFQMKVISDIISFQWVTELIFSHDNNYILGGVRLYGFVCINIKDPTNPFIESTLETAGGFSIMSSLNGKWAFVSEGAYGVGIIDLSKLPMIVFVNRLPIDGIAFHLQLIKNDTFLLVSSSAIGFISLVDVRDIKNIQVIAKYSVKGQNGFSSCANPDETYAIFANYSGITSIPLRNIVQIHTELFIERGIETQNVVYQRLNLAETSFYIGQYFQMRFYLINPIDQASLTNVFYYQNFQVIPLPYWLKFNEQTDVLDIQVVKNALGSDNSKPTLNTIIIQHQVPLFSSSFLINEDGVITTEAQSIYIHKLLRNMGLINFENFLVPQNFERQDTFSFSDISLNSSQPFLDKVKRILQKSISHNPIIFYVAASLQFFETATMVSSNNINLDQQLYFVFSIQTNVQLYLQAKQGDGKFVENYYEGVIAQISNFQTYLKLDGSVANINKVLTNKILFFQESPDTIATNKIIFHLILIDGVNYVLEKDIKLEDSLNFIVLKKPLYLHSDKSLQTQFNLQFPDGVVYIEESMSFEFNPDTFVNPDTKVINYVATFSLDGVFIDAIKGAWIQQSSNSLRFFGLIPAKEYRSIIRIKITATDGFTSISDEFSIFVNGVPFIFILSSFIKIFGPLLTIFSFYKYRSPFFNIMCRRQCIFKTEQVQVNTFFYKKFRIVSDENLKAIYLFKQFIIKTEKTLNKSTFLERATEFFQKSQTSQLINSNIFNSELIKGDQPFIEDKSNQLFYQMLKKDSNIKLIIKKIKTLLNKENKGYDNQVSNYDKLFLKIKSLPVSNKNRESKLQLFDIYRDSLMGDRKSIDMKILVKSMSDLKLKITLKNKQIDINLLLPELNDSTSYIHQALKAVASRYFLHQHPLLNLVYKFLKASAQLNYKLMFGSDKDWYLQYVRQDNDQKDQSKMTDTLVTSSISNPIDIQLIKSEMKMLQIFVQKYTKDINQVFNEQKMPFNLLYDVIYSKYLGFVGSPPSMFSPSVGDSIHLDLFLINQAQAFKRVDDLSCSFLRRLLGFDYVRYGSASNQYLPSWIKQVHTTNSITLSGTPSQEDVDSFIIRLFDTSGYIIRQFQLDVIDSQAEEIQNLSQNQDKTICKLRQIIQPHDIHPQIIKQTIISPREQEDSSFQKQPHVMQEQLTSQDNVFCFQTNQDLEINKIDKLQ